MLPGEQAGGVGAGTSFLCITTRVKCRLGRTDGRVVALEPVKNNSCWVLSNADSAIVVHMYCPCGVIKRKILCKILIYCALQTIDGRAKYSVADLDPDSKYGSRRVNWIWARTYSYPQHCSSTSCIFFCSVHVLYITYCSCVCSNCISALSVYLP